MRQKLCRKRTEMKRIKEDKGSIGRYVSNTVFLYGRKVHFMPYKKRLCELAQEADIPDGSVRV